jgi:hypothetical protein
MELKKEDPPYLLLLVSSNEDAVIVNKDACLTCLQRKLDTTVLKQWSLTTEEKKRFMKLDTCGYRVKCECPHETK